jgi:hypothetical protein
MARFLPALVLAIVLLSFEASASSISLNASLQSYLSTYIPNSTLLSASFYNMTLNHDTYAIMRLGAGANKFIVINTTNHYSVMLKASSISMVLEPFLLSMYYPNQSTLNYLNTSMHAYVSQGSGPLSDCLVETGLVQFTCTSGNACSSCQAVPICKTIMNDLGGPGSLGASPFVDGMMNFSSQYAQLNSSYSSYFSTLAKLNASNIGASISAISSAVSTVSSISAEISQNPIFSLPSSYDLQKLNSMCIGYSNPTEQPWYCVDVEFCEVPSFNSPLLSGIQSKVLQLQMSPLSNAGLSSVSANSSSIANSYVQAVVSREENESFNAFLNTTEPQYNSIMQKSQALLGVFSNSILSASLQNLEGTFTAVLKAGASQNITEASTTLANALSNATSAYSAAYAAFSPVYTIAQSNNYLLAVDQLSYAHVPASLARIALNQQKINAEINSGMNESQLPSMLSELSSVSASLYLFTPFTLGSVVKAVDGGITSVLLSGTAPLSAKNSYAALYAVMLSLVIGGVLVLLFYMFVYSRLKSKHKIKFHRRARKAWRALFILLGVAVVVYALVTYSAASGANTLLPVSGFISAVGASQDAAIVLLNGTNSSTQACSGSVEASLNNMSKSVYVISIVNGTCSSANSSFSGACVGEVAGSMPVVLISGGDSGIVYRGMYGHVLYASGAAAAGASCPLDELFYK